MVSLVLCLISLLSLSASDCLWSFREEDTSCRIIVISRAIDLYGCCNWRIRLHKKRCFMGDESCWKLDKYVCLVLYIGLLLNNSHCSRLLSFRSLGVYVAKTVWLMLLLFIICFYSIYLFLYGNFVKLYIGGYVFVDGTGYAAWKAYKFGSYYILRYLNANL